jgi:WD40 repeat protein
LNYARKRFHIGAHSFALIVVLLVMTVLAACDVRPQHARTVAVRDETILQDLYRKGSTLSPVCVDANSEKRLLAVGGSVGMNGAIRIWDVDTAELVLRIDNLPPYVRDIAFSPDGNRLAVATGSFRRPGSILVLDAMAGTVEHKLDGLSGRMKAVSFSRDGNTIVSCGTLGRENGVDGGQLLRWDLQEHKNEVLWQDQLTTLSCVDFSPNGLLFAVGGGSWLKGAPQHNAGIIQFWDGTTFQHRTTRIAHLENVESVAFLPDGQTLISGGGRSYLVPDGSPHFTLKFWNADEATPGREK